jgi:hypothetical protein
VVLVSGSAAEHPAGETIPPSGLTLPFAAPITTLTPPETVIMSTIQQLKNFIRHGKLQRLQTATGGPAFPRGKDADNSSFSGKQARVANEDGPRKNEYSPPQAQKHVGISEPAFGGGGVANAAAIPDAYSVAGDGQNRAAQAGHMAAHHAEPKQKIQPQGGASKSKRVDDIAKLVAEENESKSKFPKYPGLENWELLEKMGDGAFSNVYRARDREGVYGECAIKVVRKYEMNNTQVSCFAWWRVFRRHPSPWAFSALHFILRSFVGSRFNLPTEGISILGQQASTSGFQESPKSSRGARISIFLIVLCASSHLFGLIFLHFP